MSTLRKLFCCSCGHHKVALGAFDREESLTLPATTDLGNYIPWTYFHCSDCSGLFVGEGNIYFTRKATPVNLGLIPERHLVELKKQPWWPKPSQADVIENLLEQAMAKGENPLGGARKAKQYSKVGGGQLPDGIDLVALLDSDAGRNRLIREFGFTLEVVDGRQRLCAPWFRVPEPDEPPPFPPGLDVMRPPSSPNPTMLRVMAALAKLKEVATHLDRRRLKDQVFCHVAETVAQLGTCCRLKVGCVLLTKEGRLCGQGYNGAGPGMPHCHPDGCNETCRCRRTRHAEKNALSNCSGMPYVAFLTHEPCVDCAKDLIAEGVRRVVYLSPYTSIADEERAARQEWIDFYHVEWVQLPARGE